MSRAFFSERSCGAVEVHVAPPRLMSSAQRHILSHRQKAVTFAVLYSLCATSIALFALAVSKTTLIGAGFSPFDRISALLLLLSEIYSIVQTMGYYIQVGRTLRAPNVARTNRLARFDVPRVAIYIATYNEPEALVEETVVAVTLLDYPAKQIYLNCDHQSQEQADVMAGIARRHNINFIHRVPNKGYKAGGINEFLFRLGRDLPAADMLCIFDADSIPMPTFLRELVALFEDDSRLAFVQAPQHYGNTAASHVAEIAGLQQTVFGEYISEGKQQCDAMFYCGTNVVFRVDALLDIGGLIIDSVTEDFATSIKLHSRGWRSQYCNKSYVTGMGPTTLHAYWTQQGRWALGNIESFFASFRDILFIRGFTLAQRWEYFISGSYFLVGCNTLLTILGPAAFLLLGVRPLVIAPLFYLLAYVPQVIVSNWFFFFTMGHRGFEPRKLFLSQCLVVATFPVYAAAAMAAVLHQKRAFAVTPKGAGQTLPWSALRWQIITFNVLVVAVLVGGIKSIISLSPVLAINIGWCIYHGILLVVGLQFNQPEKDLSHKKLIAVDYTSVAQHDDMPLPRFARIATLAHRLRMQSDWIGNAHHAIFDVRSSTPDVSARQTRKLVPLALGADITRQHTRKLIPVDLDIAQQHTRPLMRVKLYPGSRSRLNTSQLRGMYERVPTTPLYQPRRQPVSAREKALTY
jgi:cellulose synthase (UDP-forming)